MVWIWKGFLQFLIQMSQGGKWPVKFCENLVFPSQDVAGIARAWRLLDRLRCGRAPQLRFGLPRVRSKCQVVTGMAGRWERADQCGRTSVTADVGAVIIQKTKLRRPACDGAALSSIYAALAVFLSCTICGRTFSMIASKVVGSAIAISDSILRFSSTPAAINAGMKRL